MRPKLGLKDEWKVLDERVIPSADKYDVDLEEIEIYLTIPMSSATLKTRINALNSAFRAPVDAQASKSSRRNKRRGSIDSMYSHMDEIVQEIEENLDQDGHEAVDEHDSEAGESSITNTELGHDDEATSTALAQSTESIEVPASTTPRTTSSTPPNQDSDAAEPTPLDDEADPDEDSPAAKFMTREQLDIKRQLLLSKTLKRKTRNYNYLKKLTDEQIDNLLEGFHKRIRDHF